MHICLKVEHLQKDYLFQFGTYLAKNSRQSPSTARYTSELCRSKRDMFLCSLLAASFLVHKNLHRAKLDRQVQGQGVPI